MADGKSIMVDVSRCTGCRGCQIACKQWNELPATETKQTGSYQNPPDLNPDTWKLVRFHDGRGEDGKPYWNFFSDMCRHCLAPGCLSGAAGDEMVQDEETGAVVYSGDTSQSDFEITLESCPYHIPRKDEKTGQIRKCVMCIDRIKDGLKPACVSSCPTGAMEFGERDEILQKVEARVQELKKTFPKVKAVDPNDVRVIYILTDDPDHYAEYVEA